jgi:hypothetical protein
MVEKRTNSDLEIFDRIVARCAGREDEVGLLKAIRPIIHPDFSYVYKDAATGRFVTEQYALMNPGQTYLMRVVKL